jgi:hypothetical protein
MQRGVGSECAIHFNSLNEVFDYLALLVRRVDALKRYDFDSVDFNGVLVDEIRFPARAAGHTQNMTSSQSPCSLVLR